MDTSTSLFASLHLKRTEEPCGKKIVRPEGWTFVCNRPKSSDDAGPKFTLEPTCQDRLPFWVLDVFPLLDSQCEIRGLSSVGDLSRVVLGHVTRGLSIGPDISALCNDIGLTLYSIVLRVQSIRTLRNLSEEPCAQSKVKSTGFFLICLIFLETLLTQVLSAQKALP
jgi:hypothetical protein